MTPQQLQQALARIFQRHGVELLAHDEWLLHGGTFPALRASWQERPDGRSGRLDVEIIAGPGRLMRESFPGAGAGEAGCMDALQQFIINDLHVLLAAFWNIQRPEEVTVEHWEIAGQPFTAYIGGFGIRSAAEGALEIPPQAFVAVESALRKTDLPQPLHWARLFHCNINAAESVREVLLDNEPWAEGEAALAAVAWPVREHFYSVRNFIVLKGPEPEIAEGDASEETALH